MIIAIVGATGLVGRTMLKILQEYGYLNNNQIILYASAKSAGTTINIGEHRFCIQELTKKNINPNISFALFSAGSQISKQWAKEFTKNGTVVIDNSNAFRRFKSIPLIVPEINMDTVNLKNKIIANPNCSTIGLCVAIESLIKASPIKRIIVSTYQAVSGAGNNALLDLQNNSAKKFIYPIANNLLPHIDNFLPSGYTKEEDKLMFEISKIFRIKIPISATAVRVPITNCHSESVNIEFAKPITITQVKNVLSTSCGVTLLDDQKNNLYPMPLVADNTNQVFVGRIRKDPTHKNTYNLFLSFDNLRKGAALNAVQIMKAYIEKFFYK